MALSWGLPVIASAPNPSLISTWQDIYVFATNQPHYDIPKFNLKPTGNGQCTDFIKVNGYEEYRGNAKDWSKYINTDKPSIGGVVVLNEGKFGHLALVVGFDKVKINQSSKMARVLIEIKGDVQATSEKIKQIHELLLK